MKLLCALVTHNRLDYTKRCFDSWLATKDLPGEGCLEDDGCIVIVDNASTDGTQEWAKEVASTWVNTHALLIDRNLFPGAATNRAWHYGLKQFDKRGFMPDLLMRLDNDIELLPGWREEVEKAFTAIPKLHMLGLLNRHEDYDGDPPITELRKNGYSVNVEWPYVGGNCVIRRKVWDAGERWQPGAWAPGAMDEDSVMCARISEQYGLAAGLIPSVANNISYHRYEDYPEYYDRTAAIRGLVPKLSV